MINVENLTYDYPMHRALDDVSFHIENATITAVVGPTGAGKTTLFRILAALVPALDGRIIVDGTNIHLHPRHAYENIGFVQDHFGVYDDLSVFQSLWYHAAIRNIFPNDRSNSVMAIIRFLDLTDFINSEVKTLSKGNKQKLAIGQAIVHNPKILILDEPAAHLDIIARRELYTLLQNLQRQGVTILVSSHLLSEIDTYANNLLILNHGKLVEHCVIPGTIHATVAVRKLKLLLSKPHKNTISVLKKISNIENVVEKSERVISFDFAGDEQQQGKLLSKLLEAGIPLYSLESETSSLNDYYINKMDNT